MKRTELTVALAMIMLAATIQFAPVASAEVIHGTISQVDLHSNKLILNRLDTSSTNARIEMSLDDDIRFQGDVNSGNDLNVGQEVFVDADQNFFTRRWSAQAIAGDRQSLSQPAANVDQNSAPSAY